jgi:excisionase family DNA binding protein
MGHTKPRRRCYSVTETSKQLSISKGLLQQEIRAGRLRVARVGRRVLVPQESIDRWLARAMSR